LSWSAPLFLAVSAAMKSFCGGTCSGLSDFQQRIAGLDLIADLGNQTGTRPENGVRTVVLASSLNAI